MRRRWRMGIIGCGWAGERHTDVLAQLSERAELCALADVDAGVARARAQAWQSPVWTDDYHDLLDGERLDAVSICLPHHLHAPAAIAAARAGLHVLVEKPLATTLDEADRMVAAADAAGVVLMVAETVRFHGAYLKAADLIRSGTVGDVFLVRISREHQMHDYLRRRPWFLEHPAGGIMYSGGIHDMEILRMLAGEIEHVYGLAGRKVLSEMAGDDTSVALAGLQSGAAAVITESFSSRTPHPGVHIQVCGSQGSMWMHRDRIRLYDAPEDGREEQVQAWVVPPGDTFQAEIAHFIDCLDTGDEPITSGRDQRAPLLAVLATYASMQRGERVHLAEFDRTHSTLGPIS
jgi:predicted dehydrogenase